MSRNDERPQRLIRLAAAIRAELAQLALVVAEAELALRDFPQAVPPPRELRGVGAIVHDFYTGAEHVFEKILPAVLNFLAWSGRWRAFPVERQGRSTLALGVDQRQGPASDPGSARKRMLLARSGWMPCFSE